MKKRIIFTFVTILVVCSFCLLPIKAEEITKGSINGYGKVEANADTAMISFSIDSTGSNRNEANSLLEKTITEIKTALKDYGSIYSEGYYSYPTLDGKTTSTQNLTIKTEKIKSIDKINKILKDKGATSICPPCYSVKNTSEWEQKALNEAITDAKARAASIGITTEPLAIKDMGASPYCVFGCSYENSGKVVFECRVTLFYQDK